MKKILIVDDDSIIREMAKEALALNKNYNIETAKSGEDAFDKFKNVENVWFGAFI